MPVSGGHARGRHVGPRPSDRLGALGKHGSRDRQRGKSSQVKSSQVKSSQVKSSQGSVSHTEELFGADKVVVYLYESLTTRLGLLLLLNGALFIYTSASRICIHLISSSQFVMRRRPTASPPGRSRKCPWRPRRRHGHSLRALPL